MKVARIQTTLRKFFHHWITITYPLHKFRKREGALLAELLYFRHKLSEEVSNDELIDKLLFSYDIKVKIAAALNISIPTYRVMLSRLTKQGVITDGVFNKAYLPQLGKEDDTFVMAYKFKIVNNGNKKKSNKKIQKNSKSK